MAWPTLTDALITTEVRALLGEPVARRVSDTEIVRYINKAVELIMKRNLACGEEVSIALVTSDFTPTATSLTNVITISHVIYTNSVTATQPGTAAKALLRMHPRHFANIYDTTAGAPQEWCWYNDTLYIWPIPSANENSKYITVHYYAYRETQASNDFYKYLPDHYSPYIIWYAYSQALMKIGKPEQALQYMSYFDNFIAFHRENDNLYTGVDSEDMMKHPDRIEFVG